MHVRCNGQQSHGRFGKERDFEVHAIVSRIRWDFEVVRNCCQSDCFFFDLAAGGDGQGVVDDRNHGIHTCLDHGEFLDSEDVVHQLGHTETAVFDSDDRLLGVEGIALDRTSERRLELELRDTTSLLESERVSRAHLLTNLSTAIRRPLDESTDEDPDREMLFPVSFECVEELAKQSAAGVSFQLTDQHSCFEPYRVKLIAYLDDGAPTAIEFRFDAAVFAADTRAGLISCLPMVPCDSSTRPST